MFSPSSFSASSSSSSSSSQPAKKKKPLAPLSATAFIEPPEEKDVEGQHLIASTSYIHTNTTPNTNHTTDYADNLEFQPFESLHRQTCLVKQSLVVTPRDVLLQHASFATRLPLAAETVVWKKQETATTNSNTATTTNTIIIAGGGEFKADAPWIQALMRHLGDDDAQQQQQQQQQQQLYHSSFDNTTSSSSSSWTATITNVLSSPLRMLMSQVGSSSSEEEDPTAANIINATTATSSASASFSHTERVQPMDSIVHVQLLQQVLQFLERLLLVQSQSWNTTAATSTTITTTFSSPVTAVYATKGGSSSSRGAYSWSHWLQTQLLEMDNTITTGSGSTHHHDNEYYYLGSDDKNNKQLATLITNLPLSQLQLIWFLLEQRGLIQRILRPQQDMILVLHPSPAGCSSTTTTTQDSSSSSRTAIMNDYYVAHLELQSTMAALEASIDHYTTQYQLCTQRALQCHRQEQPNTHSHTQTQKQSSSSSMSTQLRFHLARRKLYSQQIQQLQDKLLNVHMTCDGLETARQNHTLLQVMQRTNTTLKNMRSSQNLETIDTIVEDLAEELELAEEVQQLLLTTTTTTAMIDTDDAALERELEQLMISSPSSNSGSSNQDMKVSRGTSEQVPAETTRIDLLQDGGRRQGVENAIGNQTAVNDVTMNNDTTGSLSVSSSSSCSNQYSPSSTLSTRDGPMGNDKRPTTSSTAEEKEPLPAS